MNSTSALATPEYSAVPEPPAPQTPEQHSAAGSRSGSGPAALQSGLGNASLAAAATGESLPPPGETLQLQSVYGNAAVAQTISQASVAEHPPSRLAPASILIVDDSVESPAPGQMRRRDFLAELRTAVCRTAAEALAGSPWSEQGCPYIEYWFRYYETQSARHLERAARKYAPEATSATSARDYIRVISERLRGPVETWARTGRITGVPEDTLAMMSGAHFFR